MSILVETFAVEDENDSGQYQIQWQFPTFDLNCIANDLNFAQKIINLVDETRANPFYRDTHLGNGRYRHMAPKGIVVSAHFPDVDVSIFKCGECEHGYDLRFESASDFWISFHLADQALDDFLYGLREIIDDYGD